MIEDEKKSISADGKKKIKDACESALKWLESNHSGSKEEFEHKKKELEKICGPILAGMNREEPQNNEGSSSGPKIEEVE